MPHTLLDWNQIHRNVLSIKQRSNCETDQQAFSFLVLRTLLEFSDEEAADAATDGSQDRGIDAVAIDDREGKNDIHLFNFKYASSFEIITAKFSWS